MCINLKTNGFFSYSLLLQKRVHQQSVASTTNIGGQALAKDFEQFLVMNRQVGKQLPQKRFRVGRKCCATVHLQLV